VPRQEDVIDVGQSELVMLDLARFQGARPRETVNVTAPEYFEPDRQLEPRHHTAQQQPATAHVASADEASARKALQIITDITATAEVGKTYLGKVVRLVDFGAFVEIFPGTDGLLHISEIAETRIKEVRDELKEGDQILVKVLALEGNKIKLSRKAVLKEQREKLAKK